MGNIESGSQASNVPNDIAVSLEGRTLEAVLGDGISDVLDCEVGRSEVVAVAVEELAIVLFIVEIGRRERRERGGGLRGTRRIGGGDHGRGSLRVGGGLGSLRPAQGRVDCGSGCSSGHVEDKQQSSQVAISSKE